MRYEARRNVVYDREDDVVVEQFNDNPQGCRAAEVSARIANKNDQEWREIDTLMRSNRSLCG
jgi:hypothetical protein